MTKRPEFESHASGLLLPEIREILASDPRELDEVTQELHPADLADMVVRLDEEEIPIFFSALPVDRAADVAEYVEDSLRARLVTALDPERAARILAAMTPDDRADVLVDLDPEPAAAILARLALPQRREAQLLMQYEENTAGGLMTTQFVTLPQATRADHALALIRTAAAEKETIYAIYVTDRQGRLVGVVSLRELLASDPLVRLSDLMNEQVVSVAPDVDQEEVARLISHYDLLALPVVDPEDKLLGIVTVDDIIDVLVQESTEDVQKMGAVAPLEEPYFVSGFWDLLKKRAPWLVVLFFGEMLTATALRHYEHLLDRMIWLVAFIPLIISTGGNSGSQAATLVIRALTTGEVQVRQFTKVFLREFGMGLVLGLILGSIGLIRAILYPGGEDDPQPFRTAITVGFTIVAVVLNGCVIGALLPMGLKRLRLDPALMSAPFIASLIDVTGIIIYLTVARVVIGF